VGQDLQSGNLSQAQSDFDAIQPNNVPGLSSSSSTNDLASAFNQLATDLKTGKLSAAQQDYATVQQDLQSPLFLATRTSIIIPAAWLVLPLLRILLNSLSPNSARICYPAISPRPNHPTPLLNRNSPSLAPRSPLPPPPRATP
jgi:hypothetical protein